MADLRTDYMDDILSAAMGGERKYEITFPDGTTQVVKIKDVTEYEQIGSTFGAGDINKTNQEVNLKLDPSDVVDPMVTTESGFAADALKVKESISELNKKMDIDYSGTYKSEGIWCFGNYGHTILNVPIRLPLDKINDYDISINSVLIGYSNASDSEINTSYQSYVVGTQLRISTTGIIANDYVHHGTVNYTLTKR